MSATITEQRSLEILAFGVDVHRYGLWAQSITEVVRAVAITTLPGAPRVVEGVVNFRGTMVPVLDLRMRFGLPSQPLAATELLIIASSGTRLVAFRCDGGAIVRRVQRGEVETDGDGLCSSRFVAGLAKFADGTVVIHDLTAFLSEAESAELDSSLSSAITPAVA